MEQEPKFHFKFKKEFHIARPLTATEMLSSLNLTNGDLRDVDIALNGEYLQTLDIRGRSREKASLENIKKFLAASPSTKK